MRWSRRALELVFLAMVIVSAILLGMGQGSIALSVTAIVAAISAWIIVDWWQLFRIPRWVANVVSIGILIWTMSYFFEAQSGAQLIAVANLLVYLQSLLLFQDKAPRQYWQLIILNVLQVVVAAVFSLELEGGGVFLLYMVLAAFFLYLLTGEDEEERLQEVNRSGTERRFVFPLFGKSAAAKSPPLRLNYALASAPRDFFETSIGHLIPAIVACLAFALALFVLIPRAPDSWVASRVVPVAVTGLSQAINLDVRDDIKLNSTQVMRVKFTNMVTEEPIQIAGNPYFRAMALSRLVIRNNTTTFEAPYDRVFYNEYEAIPRISAREARLPEPFVNVDYTLDATNDPLIYCTLPLWSPAEDAVPFEVCRPLSAVVRPRPLEFIEYAPFRYRLVTRIDKQNQLPNANPYFNPTRDPNEPALRPDQGEHRSLTYLPPDRYPTVVETASRIARTISSGNHLLIAKAIEGHFLNSPEYQYTLEFSKVRRDFSLDPIEDFVRNHRSGHCQLYAAAMVVMLRSQGIPARVVVGYCGGDWVSESYVVSSSFAHAWVEAYIPPEWCTEDMFRDGTASRGGSWVRFDPTPPQGIFANGIRNSSTLQLARTLWQDYVMGLENRNDESLMDVPASRLANALNISRWTESAQRAVVNVQTNPFWQAVVISASIVTLLLLTALTFRKGRGTDKGSRKSAGSGPIRRWAASLLSMISPQLGRWVLAERSAYPTVPFYEKFLAVLGRHQLTLSPTSTHREFARQVHATLAPSTLEPRGREIVERITEAFQAVRFGGKPLEREVERQLMLDVKELANILDAADKRPASPAGQS